MAASEETMYVPFVDTTRQIKAIQHRLEAAQQRVFQSGRFIAGDEVRQFEREYAKYLGAADVVTCANGTDALEVILQTLDMKPGSEVLVPAMSWISTSEAVVNAGHVPVFVDVDAATQQMNVEAAQRAITARTKAIVVVHLHGLLHQPDLFQKLCHQHRLYFIEDAAQAHGARYRGVHAGCWGDAAAFSFYPTKNLGAFGDGGAMVYRDRELSDRARKICNHGLDATKQASLLGRNSRLDELQAAYLRAKLPLLDQWNNQRQRLACQYIELLQGISTIQLPFKPRDEQHIWHHFTIYTTQRAALQAFLAEQGVQTDVHYPLALPALTYNRRYRADVQAFPNALHVQDSVLSLPLYPGLKEKELQYVVQEIKAFYTR